MPALIRWWTQELAEISPTAFPDAVFAAGADLLARWGEPHRHYHGTQHLVEMFWALEELELADAIDAREATLGRIAAWLHDAIYDPTAVSGANEADSAALARQVLSDLECDDADVAAVEALVLATATHSEPSDETFGDALAAADDERAEPPAVSAALWDAFHDADLWIFSAPATRFDDYCAEVRAEYAHVPDPAYRAVRGEILRGFATRPHIYCTAHARQEWEPTAQSNLARELARLAPAPVDVT